MSNIIKYYLDAEFIEDGITIDLISLGIVSSDDREFYAINKECNFSKADEWVVRNVYPSIGIEVSYDSFYGSFNDIKFIYTEKFYQFAKTKRAIAHEVLAFTKQKQGTYEDLFNLEEFEPFEFWGEWPSYDWVVFCSLFGRMIDLPKGFPMRCNDVIQLAEYLGFKSDDLPESLEVEGKHDALLGAKTVKMRYEWLNTKAI